MALCRTILFHKPYIQTNQSFWLKKILFTKIYIKLYRVNNASNFMPPTKFMFCFLSTCHTCTKSHYCRHDILMRKLLPCQCWVFRERNGNEMKCTMLHSSTTTADRWVELSCSPIASLTHIHCTILPGSETVSRQIISWVGSSLSHDKCRKMKSGISFRLTNFLRVDKKNTIE